MSEQSTFRAWTCRYCGQPIVKRPDRQPGESEYTHFAGSALRDEICAGDYKGREPLPQEGDQ